MGSNSGIERSRFVRTSITGNAIANEVRMKRTQHKGAFLVVEGVNDVRAMRAFVDSIACRVVIAYGKPNALTALAILKSNANGILGLLDADFSRVLGTVPQDPNILLTDAHDMDAQLFFSPSLDKVLAEFSDHEKATAFATGVGTDIRTRVAHAASVVGHLRLYSVQQLIGLNFEGLDYPAFLNNTLGVDENVLLNNVIARTSKCPVQVQDLKNALAVVRSKTFPPDQLCSGHDLVSILHFGLVNLFGAYNSRHLTPHALAGALRIAYSREIFQTTTLYRDIREWEKRNQPFKILKT